MKNRTEENESQSNEIGSETNDKPNKSRGEFKLVCYADLRKASMLPEPVVINTKLDDTTMRRIHGATTRSDQLGWASFHGIAGIVECRKAIENEYSYSNSSSSSFFYHNMEEKDDNAELSDVEHASFSLD